MGIPVVIAPKALDDLGEIVRYIAKRDRTAAGRIGDRLIAEAERLTDFPEMGRVTPEFDDRAVREIVHGSYRIIYRLKDRPRAIHVLRFWHAARGVPEIEDDEEW